MLSTVINALNNAFINLTTINNCTYMRHYSISVDYCVAPMVYYYNRVISVYVFVLKINDYFYITHVFQYWGYNEYIKKSLGNF